MRIARLLSNFGGPELVEMWDGAWAAVEREEPDSVRHALASLRALVDNVGRGGHELRIVDQDATWRIVYFVDRDAVVILEMFSKKSRQTPKKVIDTCKKRLATYRDARSPGK